MHQFFTLDDTVQHSVMKYAGWQWVRDGLKRNIGQAISFYRRNPMAVRSDHFLVRLLQSISVPQTQNLERYFDNVDALALNLSMALKMTSSIFQGKLHAGVFYGAGSQEVLLAHTASFDFQEAHRSWQSLAPVKVLRTPRSDFGLNLPDGEATGTESGLAVIAINIPMLAIQYRAFRLDQNDNVKEDSPRSAMQFVHMYVLPNMLWSQTDQVVFNRLDRLSRNVPLGRSTKHHSFAMPNSFGEKMTDMLVSVLHDTRRMNRNFNTMLAMIPSIHAESMHAAMRLPSMAQTRQVVWALTVARLPMLAFLFRESLEGPAARNRSELNQIERSIRAFRTSNILQQYLPAGVREQVQAEIDEIMQLPEVAAAEKP